MPLRTISSKALRPKALSTTTPSRILPLISKAKRDTC